MAKNKSDTVDMMLSRTTDGLKYYVVQKADNTALVTRLEFDEDNKPDELTGAILAVCGAAGEEPFDALLATAQYLVDDEEACDAAHEYIAKHFDELTKAMKAEAALKKKDKPKDVTEEWREEFVKFLADLLGGTGTDE